MIEYNCCVCHVKHSVPKTMESWICPNGHSLVINRDKDPKQQRIKELTQQIYMWENRYRAMKLNYETERAKNQRLRKKIKNLQ